MNPERWAQIRSIFADALELPESERAAFVERSTGDEELRADILRLLRNSEVREAFVDRPPVEGGLVRAVLDDFTGPRPGELLAGRYRVQRLLGTGGMGAVHEAEDQNLGGKVAIKVVRAELSSEPGAAARFRREAQLARQVTHPNVCRIFDFVSDGRFDFLTMEYLEGETLAERLNRGGTMTLDAALPILEQVVQGLDAAHRAGVMHRDLKPSNVFLVPDGERERAVITDFGLARSITGGDTIAGGSAWAAGTPAYMAPEQIEGKALSPAADFYSLGVVMYVMATGQAPFTGSSPLQVAAKRLTEKPLSPRRLNANVDGRWEAVILRCLAYEPGDRFQSGAEIAEALRGERSLSLPRLAVRWRRRMMPMAATAGVLLMASGAWMHREWFAGRPDPPELTRWYREGVTAITDGSFHRGAQLLERALQVDPRHLPSLCRLAEAYQELDYRDKARDQMLKAMDVRPASRADGLLRDATRAYLTGEWDKALAAGRGEMDTARLLERAGRTPEALAAYRKIADADPSQAGAALQTARLLVATGAKDKAAAYLDRAEAAYRALANAEGLGEVALARAEAEDNVGRAMELAGKAAEFAAQSGSEPLRMRAALQQGVRLERQGKSDEARRKIAEVVRLAEANGLAGIAANGFLDLGYVPFAQRKYEEAEIYYGEAMRIAGRFQAKYALARAQLMTAQLYAYSKRVDKALPLLEEAQKFYEQNGYRSQSVLAMRYRGDAYRLQSRFEEASRELKKAGEASERASDKIAAKDLLARVLQAQGRFADAIELCREVAAFREAAGNRPQAQYAHLQLGYVLMAAGRLEEAAAEFKRVESEGPVNAGVRRTLELDLVSLELQRGQAAAALDRLLRLEREAAGQEGMLTDVRPQICHAMVRARRFAEAARRCRAMERLYVRNPVVLIDVEGSLAEAEMALGNRPRAIEAARLAVKYAEQAEGAPNRVYALNVLTQVLHAAGSSEWRDTREKARAAMREIEAQGGAGALKSYLSRPLVAQRVQTVDQLK